MLNLDPAKVLVILVVALVVLGPERLPRAARQLAAFWREFTRIRDQVSEEVRAALPDIDIPRIPNTSGAITNLINGITGPAAPSPGARDSAIARELPLARVDDDALREDATARVPPSVVVHPTLGEVAPLPDDPSMN